MIEANENTDRVQPVQQIRTTEKVVIELSYEYGQIKERIAKLQKAIDADPKQVSDIHKSLWREQLGYMQGYAIVLGKRIKDLIDNG